MSLVIYPWIGVFGYWPGHYDELYIKLVIVIPFPQQTIGSCYYSPYFHFWVTFNARILYSVKLKVYLWGQVFTCLCVLAVVSATRCSRGCFQSLSQNFGDLFSITLSQDVLFPYLDSLPPSPSFLFNSKNVDTAFSFPSPKKLGHIHFRPLAHSQGRLIMLDLILGRIPKTNDCSRRSWVPCKVNLGALHLFISWCFPGSGTRPLPALALPLQNAVHTEDYIAIFSICLKFLVDDVFCKHSCWSSLSSMVGSGSRLVVVGLPLVGLFAFQGAEEN